MGAGKKIAFIALFGIGLVHMQSDDQECERVTLRGCECAGQWMHDQMVFSGCAKTKDKEAEWCQIRPGSCVEDKSAALLDRFVDGISERDGQPEWDYCSPGCKIPEEEIETADVCTTYTENGCRCLKTWTFMEQEFQGCENPDSDQAGAWCIIEPQTCSEASGPVTVFPVKGLEFDYCRQDLNCTPPLSKTPFNKTLTTPTPTPASTILTPYNPSLGILPVNTMQSSEVTVNTDGGLLTPVDVQVPASVPSSNNMFLDAVTQVIGSSQNSQQADMNSLGVLESAQGAYSNNGYEEVQVEPSPQDSLGNLDPSTLLSDTIISEDTDVFQTLLGYTNLSPETTANSESQQLKQIREENDINADLFVESLSSINSSSLILLPLDNKSTNINDSTISPLPELPPLTSSQLFSEEATPTPTPTSSPTLLVGSTSTSNANNTVIPSPLLSKTRNPSSAPTSTPSPSFAADTESAVSRIVTASPSLSSTLTSTPTPTPSSIPADSSLLLEQAPFEEVLEVEHQMQMLAMLDSQISRSNSQINLDGFNQSASSATGKDFFAGRSVSFDSAPTIILDTEEQSQVNNTMALPQTSQVQNQSVLVKQPVSSQVSEVVEDFDKEVPEVEEFLPIINSKQQLNCSELISKSDLNVTLFSSVSEKLGILKEFKGTVLLPTDEAFEQFLEEQQITVTDLFRFQSNLGLIKKVLNSHVVPEDQIKTEKQFSKKRKLQNMQGQQIRIGTNKAQQILVISPYEEAEKAIVLGKINGIHQTCGFFGYAINQVIIPDITT